MSIKSWVLERLHGGAALAGRADLPARRGPLEPSLETLPAPPVGGSEAALAEHLGAYAALIGAIRDELEHFVASHVRLHLAIADRDRFFLTAIGVRCPDAPGSRALLEKFLREFRPEQIKRYLAREVIAALPNAAAIDLSQFAGLYDAEARQALADPAEGEYAELLAALRSTPVAAVSPPFQVSVVGRWSEQEAARAGAAMTGLAAGPGVAAPPGATPSTPLAGQRWEFDIEDADGRRRVVLQSVVAGRRYAVGKGEGCDLRVNGSYTSRRHAEVWRENDAWWVGDAGSTNGVRIEAQPLPGEPGPACAAAVDQPARLPEGSRIVLSARAEGPAADYPWLALRGAPPNVAAPNGVGRITPIAAMHGALPAGLPSSAAAPAVATPARAAATPPTPLTAILGPREAEVVYRITAFQAGGVHSLEMRPAALPVSLGRSRSQSLVVDRRHEGVSGHHLDITELDEAGAQVLVHGDNGVLVDGVAYAAGTRLRWRAGETMVLGASAHEHPTCTLTLARMGEA